MKHFVYTVEYKRSGKVSGKVYRVSGSKISFVTAFYYNTASTRGAIHEAFNALMDCGEIPRKYEKSSCSSWCGSGYYYGEVCEKYHLFELV